MELEEELRVVANNLKSLEVMIVMTLAMMAIIVVLMAMRRN